MLFLGPGWKVHVINITPIMHIGLNLSNENFQIMQDGLKDRVQFFLPFCLEMTLCSSKTPVGFEMNMIGTKWMICTFNCKIACKSDRQRLHSSWTNFWDVLMWIQLTSQWNILYLSKKKCFSEWTIKDTCLTTNVLHHSFSVFLTGSGFYFNFNWSNHVLLVFWKVNIFNFHHH